MRAAQRQSRGQPAPEARPPVGWVTRPVSFSVSEASLVLDVDETICEHWLYLVR